MQSPGDNDMGKSREQRTREARAAKAEAARLAAEAEAARLAAEGAATEGAADSETGFASAGSTGCEFASTPDRLTVPGSSADGSSTGSGTSTETSTASGASFASYSGTSTGSGIADSGTAYGTVSTPEPSTEPQSTVFPQPQIESQASQTPPPARGRVLSSLIATRPPDAGLTPPSSLVSSSGGLVSPNSSQVSSGSPPGTSQNSPSGSLATPGTSQSSPTPTQYIPSRNPQESQPAGAPVPQPIRQRIIGATQPGISTQSTGPGAPTPRMIGLPNPDGAQVPPGSQVQSADAPAQQIEAPTPPPPAPVKREPRPEPGQTLDGKICRHEYVRIYQRKLKGLDRRLVATRAFLPVGFKMGDFTYLSAGSYCFCSKCRKRLFPKRTEAEKQQARVERKLLKESGGIDLMAVGKPREKTFDDELEDDIDDLDDSDEEESNFRKGPGPAGSDSDLELDENLDDDKLKLDIHVDELEVESVDVEDIKAEGVKLASEDDFDEACSLDVDEES